MTGYCYRSRPSIRPVKTERWDASMVICLRRGADLHMAQLMPLPLTVSCFSKIQMVVLPFWYRLIWVIRTKYRAVKQCARVFLIVMGSDQRSPDLSLIIKTDSITSETWNSTSVINNDVMFGAKKWYSCGCFESLILIVETSYLIELSCLWIGVKFVH